MFYCCLFIIILLFADNYFEDACFSLMSRRVYH